MLKSRKVSRSGTDHEVLRQCVGVCLALGILGATTDPSLRARLHPSKARVLPGGTVTFQFESASVTPLAWRVVGPGCVTDAGFYAAPYSISRATPSARVVATYRGETDVRFSTAEVELVPGVFPGGEDCLGDGQAWSTSARGLDYVPVDVLPVATKSVAPNYPQWAETRGLHGSLVVNALICKSGHVLNAWVTWPPGAAPVPALEELALEAVHRWTFTPASFQGSPRAIVVAIPLRFPPP
jgi:TonB family protein